MARDRAVGGEGGDRDWGWGERLMMEGCFLGGGTRRLAGQGGWRDKAAGGEGMDWEIGRKAEVVGM